MANNFEVENELRMDHTMINYLADHIEKVYTLAIVRDFQMASNQNGEYLEQD